MTVALHAAFLLLRKDVNIFPLYQGYGALRVRSKPVVFMSYEPEKNNCDLLKKWMASFAFYHLCDYLAAASKRIGPHNPSAWLCHQIILPMVLIAPCPPGFNSQSRLPIYL